ncbi:unnamed protein product [Brachionus calyciflorus]|uniref:Tudor domain-containing protein n=1 Tax=Brachionus calyciflorus TaxID=104777 RepID=A0A814ALI9_9BILA|nr:unnamed protein product [Brachionus calyciflorus]
MFLCPPNKTCSIDSHKLDEDFDSLEISDSKIINQSEDSSLNSNKTENSSDSKSLNISNSSTDQNSTGSCISDDFSSPTRKRIIYTKEFLMHLRLRESSNSYPNSLLPKQEENSDFYWDPEKYFDSIKGSDGDNKKEFGLNRKSIQPRQVDIDRTNFIFNFGSLRNTYMLNPGEFFDVVLCSPIVKNNIYVNLVSMKGAFQQLSSILNVFCNNQLISLLNLNLDCLKKESLFLAFCGNVWQRVKYVSDVPHDPTYLNVFSIDNGREFQSNFFMPCPKEFSEIPGFGVNICLAGCPREFDLNLIGEFVKNLENFKMKIIFYNNQKSKYYVELFNDQRVSLNHVINPKFQKELFSYADDS